MSEITPNFSSFNISAKGMSIQKRRMDIVAENIANTNTTKTEEGIPYKRKFLIVESEGGFEGKLNAASNSINMKMNTTREGHISSAGSSDSGKGPAPEVTFETEVNRDLREGDLVFMPEHPDANEDGYVEMPNVDVVKEMIDMISASRNYEANVTAFNASKQIYKDSLEI
jgi:flagellar basal-body rod protein FlgC